MKKSTKTILATLVVAAAIGGGVAVASKMRSTTEPPSRPAPVDPSEVTAELLGSAVESGYQTYGWYSYYTTGTVEIEGVKLAGRVKWWIRVDRGADEEGTVLTTVPWRWTVFVDKPAPVGLVPIATGTKSWEEMRALEWATPVPDEVWREYNDEGMAQLVASAAGEQIDAMLGGEA